ncbi:MAG: isoprenylcysteine carboxylmethyltransferase family protein [Bdellovibrionales bacterium]|nr:isoprenylcysteine carboxylmethyltransferase family protein [Bdellovibrionales bacterium]
MTMLSIWTDSAYIISLHNNLPTKAFGLLLLILGYLRLRRTFEQLGTNYSPIFDAYLPDSIVTTGMYKQIRHPVYLYNLFISFGLALTSGSVWVLASATIGLAFLIIGIEREEDYLKANFSQYNSYSETTWKLLPYLY